ncbi:MAG: hypothetical protein DMD79_03120, partial [Candidatus Rokuibacteriota bacterium]
PEPLLGILTLPDWPEDVHSTSRRRQSSDERAIRDTSIANTPPASPCATTETASVQPLHRRDSRTL